jgi:hypothetical protein
LQNVINKFFFLSYQWYTTILTINHVFHLHTKQNKLKHWHHWQTTYSWLEYYIEPLGLLEVILQILLLKVSFWLRKSIMDLLENIVFQSTIYINILHLYYKNIMICAHKHFHFPSSNIIYESFVQLVFKLTTKRNIDQIWRKSFIILFEVCMLIYKHVQTITLHQ